MPLIITNTRMHVLPRTHASAWSPLPHFQNMAQQTAVRRSHTNYCTSKGRNINRCKSKCTGCAGHVSKDCTRPPLLTNLRSYWSSLPTKTDVASSFVARCLLHSFAMQPVCLIPKTHMRPKVKTEDRLIHDTPMKRKKHECECSISTRTALCNTH